MPSELSPLTEADLCEIGGYIAQDNPRRDEIFIDKLVARGETTPTRPRVPLQGSNR